jgi:hypothetical protein
MYLYISCVSKIEALEQLCKTIITLYSLSCLVYIAKYTKYADIFNSIIGPNDFMSKPAVTG